MAYKYLSNGQLKAELRKCLRCENKGCLDSCPVGCNPYDFIMAALNGNKCDLKRAAGFILSQNPFGGVCGSVCPDKHCMAGCNRADLAEAVNIPAIQATLIKRAREEGVLPEFTKPEMNGKKVAVIGGGPAGLAASAMLAQHGYEMTVFEMSDRLGGATRVIPKERLDADMIDADIEFSLSLGTQHVKLNTRVDKPAELLEQGFDAVVIAAGKSGSRSMPDCVGAEHGVLAMDYLKDPEAYAEKLGSKVAVIGGGAVAVDCATEASRCGADEVVMVYRRGMSDMPIDPTERRHILEASVDVVARTLPVEIIPGKETMAAGMKVKRVRMPKRSTGSACVQESGNIMEWDDITGVIFAIGLVSELEIPEQKDWTAELPQGVFYAGDFEYGASTVVTAIGHAKGVALSVHDYLKNQTPMPKRKEVVPGKTAPQKEVCCRAAIPGWVDHPVKLDCEFFGQKLINPFILSASPLTDGYEECKSAYEAGWAGVVMKTAFDGIPIHIPCNYMSKFDDETYANCDNVSGHSLDRVLAEAKKLSEEFPDRMTIVSTGGPVTGDEETDRAGWVHNTNKIEDAGAHAIEYSLSCPQGGDGSEGAIVSQNAKLAAKIISWVLEGSKRPDCPKIFKLTGAVTSVAVVVRAIKEVYDRFPNHKAGITLANSFPSADFKPTQREGHLWDDVIIVGSHGRGVTNISYLSLADVHNIGVTISGNGGPSNYQAAANFLALGPKTVQFCTAPERYGLTWINELTTGMSHFMEERNVNSVEELIGIAYRDGKSPVLDFMEQSPVKMIPRLLKPDDCIGCGMCTRCPYQAIQLDENRRPVIDPAKCMSCAFCALTCKADYGDCLEMGERTPEEQAVAPE